VKGFKIVAGDLVVGSGGYEMVEGVQKVRQDLGIIVREPYGIDRFHPDWGTVLYQWIGQPISEYTRMMIESEITRMIRNYSTLQLEAMERDVVGSRKPRFSTGEIVAEVETIETRQEADRLHMKVTVRTVSDEQVDLTKTVVV
jgi:phage baseplate assembly protein W